MDGGIHLPIGRGRDFYELIACQWQRLGGCDASGVRCDVVHDLTGSGIADLIHSALERCSCWSPCDGIVLRRIFVDLNLPGNRGIFPLNLGSPPRLHIDGFVLHIQLIALGSLQLSQIKTPAGVGPIREVIGGNIDIAVIIGRKFPNGVFVFVI